MGFVTSWMWRVRKERSKARCRINDRFRKRMQ